MKQHQPALLRLPGLVKKENEKKKKKTKTLSNLPLPT
jgi:hypothetical protein